MDIDLDIKQTWTWMCLWIWVCLTKKQVALWKPARNFDCGNLGSSHADRPIYFSPTLLHLNVLPSKRSPSYSTHTCYWARWPSVNKKLPCKHHDKAFATKITLLLVLILRLTSLQLAPHTKSSRAALGSLLKSWSKHDLLSKQRLSINVFSEGHGVTSTKSAEAECASGSRAEGT